MKWIPRDLSTPLSVLHWGLGFQHTDFGGDKSPAIVDAHTSAVDNERIVSAKIVVVTQRGKYLV